MLLDPLILLSLTVAALFTGFVKAGLPALGGLVSIALVLIFPAKDALGITLLYFIAGDLSAVAMHWRTTNWSIIKRLLPSVFLGIAIGALTLSWISDYILGAVIGLLIITLVIMEPFRDKIAQWAMRNASVVRSTFGISAGFTTTVGNAAGPIITIYFLLLKMDKYSFVGTAAFFFLIVNLTKLPFYGAIDIFKGYYMWSYLLTVPFVFVGAFIGKRFLHWVPQERFNQVVLLATALAGIWLLVRYFNH